MQPLAQEVPKSMAWPIKADLFTQKQTILATVTKVWTNAAESAQSHWSNAPKAPSLEAWFSPVSSGYEWALRVWEQVTFNLIKSPLRDNYNFLRADYRFWNQPRQEDKYMVCLRKKQGKCVFHTSLFKKEKKRESQKYIQTQHVEHLPVSSHLKFW